MTEIYPDDGRLVNATPAPTRISGLPDDDRATFLQHTMHKTYNKTLLEGQFLLIFHPNKSIK